MGEGGGRYMNKRERRAFREAPVFFVLKQPTTAPRTTATAGGPGGGGCWRFVRSLFRLLVDVCVVGARAPWRCLLHPRCARLPFCCVAFGATTDARRYRAGRRDCRGVCCDTILPLFTLFLQRHMDRNARIRRLLDQCPMRAAKCCIVHHQC